MLWSLAAAVVLLFVLQLFLDTRRARDWGRKLITQRLEVYLDRPVVIDDISFELLPFSLEIWGLAVAGPENGDAAFLEVPWAYVEADISSLPQQRIHLRQIKVERPRVFLHFLPDGSHNLLDLRHRRQHQRRFDLFIDHIEIDRAEFALDQESVRLSISADDLHGQLQGLGEMRLTGSLSGQNVTLRLPNAAAPQVLDFVAEGELGRGRLDILKAAVSSTDFDATGDGFCQWTRQSDDKKCYFQTRANTRGRALAELGYFTDLEGELKIDGSFHWRPLTYGWRSQVSSPRLTLWDRQIDNASGTLVADRYGLQLVINSASYGGGQLSGNVAFERSEPGEPITIDLAIKDVGLDTLLADQKIPVDGLAARASGALRYRFPRQQGDLGKGGGELELRPDPQAAGLLLSGTVPISIERGVVRTDPVRLAAGNQNGLIDGWYDLRQKNGQWDYQLATADLGELAALLPLSDEQLSTPQLWLPHSGEGELAGTFYLSPQDSHSEVRMKLSRVRTPGLSGDVVNGSFEISENSINGLQLEISSGREALLIKGRVPFDYEQSGESTLLSFDAVGCTLETIRPWLSFDLPLDGRVSGRLDLEIDAEATSGTLRATLDPAHLVANPDTVIDVEQVETRLSWDAQELRIDHLEIRSRSGRLAGGGTFGWQDGTLNLHFSSPGLEIGEAPLKGFLPRPDMRARISLDANLGGTLESPEIQLLAELPKIFLGGQALAAGASRLQLSWAGDQLQASGRLLDLITIEGGGRLDKQRANLAIDLVGPNLRGLLDLLLERPPETLGGSFRGQLLIAGNLEHRQQPDITLEFDSLDIALRGRQLHNLEPIVVHLSQDRARIESFFVSEDATASDFFLSGDIGFASGAPLDLRLQSSLSTSWLRLLYPDLELDGYFDLLGKIGGTLASPWLDGQGEVSQATMMLPKEFPHTVDGMSGVLLFYPHRVVIDQLKARLAGGQVSVEGRFELPQEHQPLDYQLQLVGRDLRLRYPEGFALVGDADLDLRPYAEAGDDDLQAMSLGGSAQLELIEYLPDLPVGFDDLLRGFFQRQRLEVEESDELLSSIHLNIDIDGLGAVAMHNNLAELTGSADLVLRGTAARPVIYGDVDIDPGGQLRYLSTDYEVRRCKLTFTNPYSIEPEIDLEAVTRVRNHDITLAISGPLDRPETRFSSEPPLPSTELFRILSTGDEQELTARAVRQNEERGEQSLAAASFLYGQAASVIGNRVSNLFGFDKFRIDPLTESGDSISRARVTVGKRVAEDLFLTYSVDPSSTEEQRLRLEWQVDRGLTLVLTQNGDGSYSADARWEKTF